MAHSTSLAEVRLPYLNCPFCPAQALPGAKHSSEQGTLVGYKCPAQHKFYIEEENEK